jgi:deoxyadenosine/deoxycytidine kinase
LNAVGGAAGAEECPVIIWISGPTGSGKSTLAGLMGGTGYRVIREELPHDLFQAFRRDPAQHCASLQEAIILSRATQWRIAAGRKNVVFDRSVDEDIAIFCKMHHERGLLDYSAYARLRFLAENIIADLPKPDLVIYLSPRLDVLTNRVIDVGHPRLIVDNLQRQVVLYEEWFRRQNGAAIRIDNSACDQKTLESLFRLAAGNH